MIVAGSVSFALCQLRDGHLTHEKRAESSGSATIPTDTATNPSSAQLLEKMTSAPF